MNQDHLIQFLQEQSALADFRSKSYTEDPNHRKRPQRNMFVRLNKYVSDFIWGNSKIRWVTLTGLRGSGKTTMLFQLYSKINASEYKKLFLSLDMTHGMLGVSLKEVLDAYEKLLGVPFEMLDRPMVIFLDEVQYDPTWWITLKTLYDRTDKVFIMSTGSAALMLNTNADIARRAVFEKMLPLSFTEYLKITKEKYEIRGLGLQIQEALWNSRDAKESYDRLRALTPSVNEYYTGVMRLDYQRYLWYGSLPHMVDYGDEAIVYEQIQKTLDRIIHSDLPMVKFHPDTVSTIPAILYALADMDSCSVSKMTQRFDLSRPKIEAILEALEGAELLRRIYPQWNHLNQVASQKPSKYLFSAPAFRAVYFRLTSNIISDENAKGRITEDLVGMYLSKIFERSGNGSLTYDSAEGGADFILHLGGKTIIIEVWAGSKWYRQVVQTMKKVESSYGIVISEDSLELNETENIIKIPLRTFLLM